MTLTATMRLAGDPSTTTQEEEEEEEEEEETGKFCSYI
jgi:hypothetical protein